MRLKIRQMIKLMSLGFIGLALLSCSKGNSEPEYQKPMSFNGYTARSATKAGGSFVTGNALPSGQAFGVYAYNTGTEAEFDPTRVAPEEQGVVAYGKFMSDVKVTYNGGDASSENSYDYSPHRYWPNDKENNRLAFFAYYPYKGDGIGITQTGFADFTFTVQEAPANQVDFMLSDVVPNQMYGATNQGVDSYVVGFKFYHMLTQIRFKAIADFGETVTDIDEDGTDDITIKIDKIKLLEVLKNGTLAPNVVAKSSSWTSVTDTTHFEITPKSMNLPTAEAAFIAEDNQTLLMIPQELSPEDNSHVAQLSVTYTITTPSPADPNQKRTITQTKVIDLSKALISEGNYLTAWTPNQQIVYTLKIGLHLIWFSAGVEDWTNGPGDNIGI